MLAGDIQRSIVVVLRVLEVGTTANDGITVEAGNEVAGSAAGLIPVVAPARLGAARPISRTGQTIAVRGHTIREQDDDLLCRALIGSKYLLGSINTGLHIGATIIDITYSSRRRGNSLRDLSRVVGQPTVTPVFRTKTHNGDLIAGSNAVFIEDAGDKLVHSSSGISAPVAIHTIGAVDAQHDMNGLHGLQFDQIGSSDSHRHIKVIASGVRCSLMDSNHTVRGLHQDTLLHNLTITHSAGGVCLNTHAAQENAEE